MKRLQLRPPPQPSPGPQGFAVIKDGAYDTSKGIGRAVGSKEYIVKIRGFDGKPANELPRGQPLFAEYRKEIDLPARNSEQEFKVEP
jgi:hypothetical protein